MAYICEIQEKRYRDSGEISSSSTRVTSPLEPDLQQHEPEPPPLRISLRLRFRLSFFYQYYCLHLLHHRCCYQTELAANVVTLCKADAINERYECQM